MLSTNLVDAESVADTGAASFSKINPTTCTLLAQSCPAAVRSGRGLCSFAALVLVDTVLGTE